MRYALAVLPDAGRWLAARQRLPALEDTILRQLIRTGIPGKGMPPHAVRDVEMGRPPPRRGRVVSGPRRLGPHDARGPTAAPARRRPLPHAGKALSARARAAARLHQLRGASGTPGKLHLRRVPDDAASASGLPGASAQSLRHPGLPLQHWRISADADGNACSAVFELAQRAVRIAPRT